MTDIPAFSFCPDSDIDGAGTYYDTYADNAQLIAHVHALGYLTDSQLILDPTYGLGNFWKDWTPPNLTRTDLHPINDLVMRADFRDLPFDSDWFDAVVFDPPYKLNGTDQGEGERYGVDKKASWQERMELMWQGLAECYRVTRPHGYVLMKLQDQVASGAVRWQRFIAYQKVIEMGGGLVDMFDMIGGRPQPAGRRQVHARRNASTLMVFVKGEK